MLRWPEASQHPQPPPGPSPACPGHPAVTAGGPTVSSTIGWAPGRGPGPTHHPPGSPSSSSWAAPGAELDGMVGVGDVGLFGGQRWKERDQGARSQGWSSSNAPSAGMALPRASAPTPPTAALPPDPSRPHRGCWPGGPIRLHPVPLGGPSLELSLLTPSLCGCHPHPTESLHPPDPTRL